MSHQHESGPLPNRWLRCPRKGSSLIAERFLAFKTPLSQAFKDKMSLEYMFPPEMLFQYCKAINMKLGLWIDLTNTKRFYDRKIIESHGANYIKLQCRGHGETPSPEQTRSFIEIVDEFLLNHPVDIIGVHCTHGFNRTGFLIVSYMVERMDCSVEGALSAFSDARPPGIYKQDYINELFKRYDPTEDILPAPELPEWCFDYDDSISSSSSSTSAGNNTNNSNNRIGTKRSYDAADLQTDNDDATVDDNIQNGGTTVNGENKKIKKRKAERILTDATFMEGVSGIHLVTDVDIVTPLQNKVQDFCGWESNGFPGAQPVSMNRKNITFLFDIPYRVSWKADGTRYMMLINGPNEIYFFDRNFSCFQVEHLTFPKADNLGEHLTDTLLDGEMVLDKDCGVIKPRYLVYDIVQFGNENIGKQTFPKRLECIKNNIIAPRNSAITRGIIDKRLESFGVHNKPFWTIQHTAKLLSEKFAKSLLHEPDGLIYQPRDEPYIAGQCDNVLKWKPHILNSVDFRLKISLETGLGILTKKIGLLYVGGKNKEYAKIKYNKQLAILDGKIIECSVNPTGDWEFMRERTDKSLPNSFKTADAVLQSIREPVTEDYLVRAIAARGYLDHDKVEKSEQHHHQQQQQQHVPHRKPEHQQQQQLQQPQQLQHQHHEQNYHAHKQQNYQEQHEQQRVQEEVDADDEDQQQPFEHAELQHVGEEEEDDEFQA